MDALAVAHNAVVQMIDTSIVRVHRHGSCMASNREQQMGRSRGGLTSKIHAVVDANGLPVRIGLTPGEVHDNRLCAVLLSGLHPHTMLLADRGYDADWIREFISAKGAWPNIPPKRNRKQPICFQPLPLPSAQSGRTVLQSDQAMPARSDPIQQTRCQLSRLRQARIDPAMAARL
jgi:transposase